MRFTFLFFQVMACLFYTNRISGQGPAFREGYVITMYGDTIRGLIMNNAPEDITYRDSRKHDHVFYPQDLNGYMRCNMEYVSTMVPGDTARLFIAHLLKGPLDLYATIIPKNVSDFIGPGVAGGFLGGVIGSVVMAAVASNQIISVDSVCKNDMFAIKNYYVRKGKNGSLKKVPNGRKKFKSMMIPLMWDHKEVVKDIPEGLFFSGNTISIVRKYNAGTEKITK